MRCNQVGKDHHHKEFQKTKSHQAIKVDKAPASSHLSKTHNLKTQENVMSTRFDFRLIKLKNMRTIYV